MSGVVLLSNVSCTSNSGAASARTQAPPIVQTDLAALSTLITLPVQPQAAQWITQERGQPSLAPGPTDWELIAVLQYDPASAAQLRHQIKPDGAANAISVDPAFVQAWFPAAVKQSFGLDPASNLRTLTVEHAAPTAFVRSPLLQGYCFMTADNQLFLYLFTT